MASAHSILVAVATFNERDNLRALLTAIHEQLPAADVLITDDNSPDGTGLLADLLATTDQRVHVCHRPGKLGLGNPAQRVAARANRLSDCRCRHARAVGNRVDA